MREEDCKWDSDDKLIYKGVKLFIPRESLDDFDPDEVSHIIESQYLLSVRYKRESILNKLNI